MYDNIGSKIKTLAKILFFIMAILSIVIGIVFLSQNKNLHIQGITILILGPIIAWISTWLLYGYGEIIEKTCEIACNTRGTEIKSEAQMKSDYDKIYKLERLRSQGLISEEEYQQSIIKRG